MDASMIYMVNWASYIAGMIKQVTYDLDPGLTILLITNLPTFNRKLTELLMIFPFYLAQFVLKFKRQLNDVMESYKSAQPLMLSK